MLRCHTCKKLCKENTLGNNKYCQGHDWFDKHVIVTGLDDDSNKRIAEAVKKRLSQEL